MRIFSTRHGQVLSQKYFNDDMNFPAGDEPITELGRKQARILGAYLRDEVGFKGVIYASPYDRTMETASIISEELGVGFIPLPCLREMFVTYNASRDFVGLRAEEIKEAFPRAEVPLDMPYPWWTVADDELSDVVLRLKEGLEPILTSLPKDTDVLLVGHAATVVGLREVFHPENYKSALHWNCCLNLLYSSDGSTYTHDIHFMPEEITTANYAWYSEQRAKYEASLSEGISFFSENKGARVLHIGDTLSPYYPEYIEMIRAFKPDIIIHTGDFADEIKAGRVEKARRHWSDTVPTLISAMRESGARVIAVCGNNDLPDELSQLMSFGELYPRNSVIEIEGVRVCLNHEVLKIDSEADADIHLYGHGLTGEERTRDDNIRGGVHYFNAVWGASLHDLEGKRHLILSPLIKA